MMNRTWPKGKWIAILTFLIVPSAMAAENPWQPKPNPSWLMLQSMEKAAESYPTMKIWGLVDAVYSYDDSRALTANTGSLRRVYLGAKGSWMQNIDYFALTDFGTGVAGRTSPLLLDASITLKHIPYIKARFGQFKVPFGLEGLESHFTPPLINFTRASVQLLSFSAPLTVSTSTRLSSNSAFRDIGIQLFDEVTLNQDFQIVYALAAFNGNGINATDDNKEKDLSARLEFASQGFRLGLSYLNGLETSANIRKERVGIDATYNFGPLHLGTEWIWARDRIPSSVDDHRHAWGWHIRASYLLTDHLQPVVRYELFDPNSSTSENDYEATTIGVNWIFKGYTRLQLNYEFRKDRANSNLRGLVIGQVQVLF